MRDVAARAGVSFKTVSRVVNDEGGVSPALGAAGARRDRRAGLPAECRGPHAAPLRQPDASIGLLLEDVGNPYSAAVQRAVEDVAVPRGVMVFSASLDEDPARERALAREFGARHADGLMIAPAGDDQSYLAAELRAGTSIVCVDREASNLPVDSVITTNVLGAAGAVRHLAAVGHRRIAYLGDRSTIPTARQRFEGYRDALRELGLPQDPALVVHDLRSSAAADGAVTALLGRPDPPTALFTAQNMVTIGAVRGLRKLGLEHTVAVVGFDDFQLADMLSPGVSVVAQDPPRSGASRRSCCSRASPGTRVRPSCGWCPPRSCGGGPGRSPPLSTAGAVDVGGGVRLASARRGAGQGPGEPRLRHYESPGLSGAAPHPTPPPPTTTPLSPPPLSARRPPQGPPPPPIPAPARDPSPLSSPPPIEQMFDYCGSMGWNNPDVPWSELEAALSGRPRDGSV